MKRNKILFPYQNAKTFTRTPRTFNSFLISFRSVYSGIILEIQKLFYLTKMPIHLRIRRLLQFQVSAIGNVFITIILKNQKITNFLNSSRIDGVCVISLCYRKSKDESGMYRKYFYNHHHQNFVRCPSQFSFVDVQLAQPVFFGQSASVELTQYFFDYIYQARKKKYILSGSKISVRPVVGSGNTTTVSAACRKEATSGVFRLGGCVGISLCAPNRLRVGD